MKRPGNYGKIDGRDTVRTTTTDHIVMPGTNGGVSAKLHKTMDVEYVLPKETQNRQRVVHQETYNAPIDKQKFDEGYDKIDWSNGADK